MRSFAGLYRALSVVGVAAVLLSCSAPSVLAAADGWASMNGGTTGGEGGPTVTVTNQADLLRYIQDTTPGPYIVQVMGTITIASDSGILISANKTLRGLGSNATLIGNVKFKNRDGNIIIENMNLTNPCTSSVCDGVSVKQELHNILITKCTIFDTGDGALDISNESDYVTVSWCKFYYNTPAPAEDHRFACLIGSSDGQTADRGKLRVTYHHNWWANRVKERMPRVRFGQVHVYNNYYSNLELGGYCIGVGVEANLRVENNYFNTVPNPWADYFTGNGAAGHIGWNDGNIFYNCSMPTWAPNEYTTVFTPPYAYNLDNANDVPAIVQAYAGAGKMDDTAAPMPDPMTFAASPQGVSISSISMVATTATDSSGVEYYFHCTTAGGHDSGWQDGTSYIDTGLADNTTYTYQVKARDKSPGRNETAYSAAASGTTQIFNDLGAPTPDPMTWGIPPVGEVGGSITMTAQAAIDVSGVEYLFECISGGGHSSGWQDSVSYTDTGLSKDVTYTYTVTARDKSPNQNQTGVSVSASATIPSYSCSSPLAGDFNRDCQVGFADFAIMAANWMVCNVDPASSCR
jgi:pectate lyase